MIVPKLEILESLRNQFSEVSFDGVHLICAQHVLASTISLFNTLFDSGLAIKNLSVIGKCYSTRPDAVLHLLDLGIDIDIKSTWFHPYRAFDLEFRKSIRDFLDRKLRSLADKNWKKLVILDDGGELLLYMNEILHTKEFLHGKIVGIEQTSSGYEKIKRENLLFPVINAARSSLKLVHESPVVSKIAVERLTDHLNILGLTPTHALILGNGAIGAQMKEQLQQSMRVATYDKQQNGCGSIENLTPQTLGSFDLIVGCTGTIAMSSDQISCLKKGCCLASVSSSDREFDGVNLRKHVRNIVSCHDDIFSQGLYLLNCGFPINFDDAYEVIDAPEFQLTRGILYAGICQALARPHANGLIELDMCIQNDIYNLHLQSVNPGSLR